MLYEHLKVMRSIDLIGLKSDLRRQSLVFMTNLSMLHGMPQNTKKLFSGSRCYGLLKN